MTTTVTIDAHCTPDKEVIIEVMNDGIIVENFTLNDGETKQVVVYDARMIVINESVKPTKE